jgi:hypothetical protein
VRIVPSTIAWLDASREDQKRMREIVNLFTQSESRDELGIGQVRDVFSDSLFPGTSTLHTRARYFLFIPWCFMEAEAKGLTGGQLERRVENNERTLISTLKDLHAVDGLIGRVAGIAVKTLPSSLYWSALRQYNILQVAEPLDALGLRRLADPEQEELSERVVTGWSPTLPDRPPGFPRHLAAGFELSGEEAHWLQERMLGGSEGTLLHHLVSDGRCPDPTTDAPWDDPMCSTTDKDILAVLEHARLFALVVHGASLLYNLLIAERYVAEGHTKVESPVEDFRTRLDLWSRECRAQARALSGWNRTDFWRHVLATNPLVTPPTQQFLKAWFEPVCRLSVDDAADNEELRRLVRNRELRKDTQSRLTNDRLLASWSGEAGTRRLTFRWSQVNRILQDLHIGLEVAHAAP